MSINLTRRSYRATETHKERTSWIVTCHFLTPEGRRIRRRKSLDGAWSRGRVEKWARRWEAELVRHGGAKEDEKKKEAPTFTEFASRFMRDYPAQKGLKPSSIESYHHVINNHFVPRFGDRRVDEIGVREYGLLANVKLDATTRNGLLARLKCMLSVAEGWGLRGPAPKYRRIRTDERSPAAYTPAEYDALKAAAPTDEHLVVVLLGGEAALRSGEILALKVRDLDLKERMIAVSRSRWREHEDSTKGRRERVVPMTDTLFEVLARVCASLESDDYVASGCRRPMSRSALKHRMRVCEARVSGRKVKECPGRVHVLRHTCATDMLHGGAPLPSVQVVLGHTTVEQTRRYTHVRVEHLVEAMRRLQTRRSRSAADTPRSPVRE